MKDCKLIQGCTAAGATAATTYSCSWAGRRRYHPGCSRSWATLAAGSYSKPGRRRKATRNWWPRTRKSSARDKEIACKNATSAFLQGLWSQNPSGITWDKRGDSRECLLIIARCARLLASLRGAINIWHDESSDKLSHSVPVIEKPNRINCLLYNLARGHAVICGRRQLCEDDLWPVLDVTFDSAPTIRARLFRGLLEAGGTLTTSGVVELLNCSAPRRGRKWKPSQPLAS